MLRWVLVDLYRKMASFTLPVALQTMLHQKWVPHHFPILTIVCKVCQSLVARILWNEGCQTNLQYLDYEMLGSGDVTWNISWRNNLLSPFEVGVLHWITGLGQASSEYFGLVMGRFLTTRAMMVQWLMCGPVESSSLFWWLDISHLMKRIWTPSTARCDIFSAWVAFCMKIPSSPQQTLQA